MPVYSLENKVIALTGSTGGLGQAIAKALIGKGARVALLDLKADAVEEQAHLLGEQARGWYADVRDYRSLEDAMARAAEHFGGIDVVIANAGVTAISAMETTTPTEFERIIDINLNGVWRTFRAALPWVSERKGYLMAISSMAAFVHSPLQSHYTASKAGVWAMCDSIRLEVKRLGVGVGVVHPTFFRTPLMDDVHENPAGQKLWQGNRGGIWKMIPLEKVVDGVVQGIEKRRDIVVLPGENNLIARAPGLFRKVIEKLGFRDRDIAKAIDLSRK